MMYIDFTTDAEKMYDFFELTKEEFLQSYSYLNEAEYDLTAEKVNNMTAEEIQQLKAKIAG